MDYTLRRGDEQAADDRPGVSAIGSGNEAHCRLSLVRTIVVGINSNDHCTLGCPL